MACAVTRRSVFQRSLFPEYVWACPRSLESESTRGVQVELLVGIGGAIEVREECLGGGSLGPTGSRVQRERKIAFEVARMCLQARRRCSGAVAPPRNLMAPNWDRRMVEAAANASLVGTGAGPGTARPDRGYPGAVKARRWWLGLPLRRSGSSSRRSTGRGARAAGFSCHVPHPTDSVACTRFQTGELAPRPADRRQIPRRLPRDPAGALRSKAPTSGIGRPVREE